MYSFKSIISKVNSWKDFKNALEPLSKLEKGNAFEERLQQAGLQPLRQRRLSMGISSVYIARKG